MTAGTAKLSALLLILSTTACQDNTRPDPPSGNSIEISAHYICGNSFDIQSGYSAAVTVGYEVIGTSESGELALPAPATGASASTTRLVTLQAGALRVSYEGEELEPVANGGAACSPPPRTEPQATLGEWSAPFDWPVVAVHLHLLPNGKVLSWGGVGMPQVWDPQSAEFAAVPSTTMLFCSGHSFLPDGRLLVSGGHITEGHGLPDANIFDPAAQAWIPAPAMRRGRWYPTNTTLPDGEVLTLAGRDEAGTEVDVAEVWDGTGWRALSGAPRSLPYYPRAFVAPNGMVFYAGELPETFYLDTSGPGEWIPVASSQYGRRDYGSAVMYRPGKVLIVGGSDPPDGAPTNTAEIIDLNDPTPAWRYTDPMARARRQFNTTLLPDGTVLATGGTSFPGFSDPSGAVRAAEMWDPAVGRWTELASNGVTRVYHSTTLLLPDGRVLHAGSGDGAGLPRELNAEIFSPPYLFRGPRPTLTQAPDEVGYGSQFVVTTPDAGRVVRVTLIRLGSVTHDFDQNQRFLELLFQRTSGGLVLAAPSGPTVAPPGHYMLFILTQDGVPSTSTTLLLK